jgi:hypothetical protein
LTAPSTTDTVAEVVAAAEAARSVQLRIRAQLMQDVTKLWPALDAKRISETWPGWIRAMLLLTKSYQGQSSAAAGASYRLAREHATQSPAPLRLVKIAPAPDEEWVHKAFGYAGPGMLSRDTARPGTALSTTLGTATRIVLDGGRTTTVDTAMADPVAVGWYRVTDGNPCAFCALLASRGIVFKQHSFDAADTRFTGSEMADSAKVHNHCGCILAPAFSRQQTLPAINAEANKVYRAATKGARTGTQLAEFRKAWDTRKTA